MRIYHVRCWWRINIAPSWLRHHFVMFLHRLNMDKHMDSTQRGASVLHTWDVITHFTVAHLVIFFLSTLKYLQHLTPCLQLLSAPYHCHEFSECWTDASSAAIWEEQYCTCLDTDAEKSNKSRCFSGIFFRNVIMQGVYLLSAGPCWNTGTLKLL